jgi:phosphohistidine phosphatase
MLVTLRQPRTYNIAQIRSEIHPMRRLILLRHAKTERDSPSGQDRDRRLDPRGREDTAVIAGYLAEHKLVPGLALVSPATRTRETWELLAAALKSPPAVDFVGGLYGADASELLQIIRMASGRAGDSDLQSIMVVAHNPGLHELALALSGNATKTADRAALEDNLPTSGLAAIKFAIDDWNDVSVRRGTLERFVSPQLLRLQREGS